MLKITTLITYTLVATLTLVSFFVVVTRAALFVNTAETLVYDSVTDLTWMTDANYVITSGYIDTLEYPNPYNFRGHFKWKQANTYVGTLEFGGGTGWRLPADATQTETYGTNGELGIMYHTLLGNDANNATLTLNDGSTLTLSNIDRLGYWTGQRDGTSRNYWTYNMGNGSSSLVSRKAARAIWPVHDGNLVDDSATWQGNSLLWQGDTVEW